MLLETKREKGKKRQNENKRCRGRQQSGSTQPSRLIWALPKSEEAARGLIVVSRRLIEEKERKRREEDADVLMKKKVACRCEPTPSYHVLNPEPIDVCREKTTLHMPLFNLSVRKGGCQNREAPRRCCIDTLNPGVNHCLISPRILPRKQDAISLSLLFIIVIY